MNQNRRRNAFTLIEVLIVVIIMAVLAATIIPQFSSSTKDAKESTLRFNLQSMRAQIQRYRFDHNGAAPTTAAFTNQLTQHSNVTGGVSATNTDGLHPFGPYMTEIAANPFNNLRGIVECTARPTAEASADTAGWQYDPVQGEVYANTTGYFDQ